MLSSCRYQRELNIRQPADERLEQRRKKIAEERPKKQAYHDLAVQRINAALALKAQEEGSQANAEHADALRVVRAGGEGRRGYRIVGSAQDPVPMVLLGDRRAASSRYRVVAPKESVLAEGEGGARAKPASATAADMAAELREGGDAEDVPLTPEEQAALTADMAELCELGSAPPAVDGEVEEPEPATAPPPSDGEEEEEPREEAEQEEGRPSRSCARRARSASTAQPTQSDSRAAKQPRPTSSAAGSRGSAPCPRPKRSASRTASAGALVAKKKGKKKE